MRGLVLAAVTAAGIGLLGLAGASAMPANGIAVGQAVAVDQMIEQVWWRRRYHCRWHRWHRWRRW
jgi:hypothetical protein